MPRQPAVAGGRKAVVCIRLSDAEAQLLDTLRAGLSRSEFLRLLIRQTRGEA